MYSGPIHIGLAANSTIKKMIYNKPYLIVAHGSLPSLKNAG